MKYLLAALLVASIAGAEALHALSSEAADGAMCAAPEGKAGMARDVFLAHLKSHL